MVKSQDQHGDRTNITNAQTDVPADLRISDAFGHEDYAAAASSVLLAAQSPFTLGIFGDWGIGKTTIIHGIRDAVVEQRAAYVEFDVWRYEDDAFRRQFLREVATQLAAAEQLKNWGWRRRWKQYDPAIELRDLEADVPVPAETFRFSWKALLVATLHFAVIFLPAWFLLRHTSVPSDLWGHRSKVPSSSAQVAAAVIAGIAFLYTLVNRIFTVDQRYVTIRRIEEPERFGAKFRTLLEMTKASRVVVAIDDLDRCRPQLVDKFLAMLKTYVEPVAREQASPGATAQPHRKGADAVFVISADEAAVRRHMIARELESVPRITAASEQQQLREAEYQVDEYLRKFFNAVIRVRPLLPEDIKRFTRGHLVTFLDEHLPLGVSKPGSEERRTDEDQRERLVAMVAGALRKNPRRIKQFVHNLDARVRTIKQREESGRIARGISKDILGIAKIAIIEEEWRDEYDQLELNPRLLAEWQTQALTDGLANRDLRSFLQFNRDITPLNVEAVVNLKLEADDLALPELGVFRDAVAYGDFDSARDVIARAPTDVQAEYAVRLPELLSRELGRDGFVEARNVLDASLQDPPLGLPDYRAQERMVTDSLAYPQVVNQFLTLDPKRFFNVLDRLPADDQRKARAPFLNLANVPATPPNADNLHRVCEELAIRLDHLAEDERRQLEQSIAQSQHMRSSWLPLVERDPALLSESAVNEAFQALMVGEVDPETPEFKVVMAGFSRNLGQQFYAQYLDRVREFVPTAMSETGRLKPLLSAAAETLSGMPVGVDPSMQSLVATIRSSVDPIIGQLGVDGVLGLMSVAASSDHLESIAANAAAAEARQLAQDTLSRHTETVAQAALYEPATFEGEALDAVRAWFENFAQSSSPATSQWPLVVDALIALAADARALVRDAVSRYVTAGQAADASSGLERLLTGPHRAQVAAWLEEEDFSEILESVIPDLGTRLVAQLDAADFSQRVVDSLAFLARQWTTLTVEEQARVARSVSRWLEAMPEATGDLGRAVASLPGATVDERRPLVQAFVRAARATRDEAVRASALDAAAQISGNSKTLTRLWERMRPAR